MILTTDSTAQQQRITELDGVVAAKLAELKLTIDVSRQSGTAAALHIVHSGRGQKEMEDIRAIIARMDNAERLLEARRERESISSEEHTRVAFAGVTIVSLVLLVFFYIVIVRSIEERRRSAEAIQKREEWLSTTLRSIGDAVIATDAKGAILFMNSVAEQLTGWTQLDVAGKDASEVFAIINETTRDTVVSPISQVIRENRIVGLANHTLLVARDGTEKFIDDSGAPIHDAAGQMIGVVLVFRDISERKSAQDQREQHMAETEALNSRLQRAITETHHRVKNNLQIISAMVELQTSESDGTLPADDVKRLGTNIRTLAAVQDVLTQESRRETEISDISIKEILKKLVTAHQQMAASHEITADLQEIRLPGEQGTALALLANELLSNAIKHGKSVVHITMFQDADRNTLEMRVSDDGPGFKDGFDPVEAANTGLDLIVSLAEWDLHGELSFGNHANGGIVHLRMPLPAPLTRGTDPSHTTPVPIVGPV